MQTDSNDFDALRRLLKLKRYEQPPPGYFDRFSSSVLQQLRQDAVPAEAWWQKLLGLLELRPVFAGSLAMGAVGLYLIGLNLGSIGAVPAGSPMLSEARSSATLVVPDSPLAPLPVEHHASMGSLRLGVSLAAAGLTSAPPSGLFAPGGPQVGDRHGLRVENVSFGAGDFR